MLVVGALANQTCKMADFIRTVYLSGVLLFLAHLTYVRGDDVCYTEYGRHIQCEHGCCGRRYNEYCCAGGVGLIVGAVVAGLFVTIVVISIVCCCYHVQKKKRIHTGTSLQRAPNDSQVVHIYHTNPPWPGPPNNWQPPQPPAYGYVPAPPPSYGKPPDPAFPPPAYTSHTPQNYGASAGHQQTPPSAPPENRANTGPL